MPVPAELRTTDECGYDGRVSVRRTSRPSIERGQRTSVGTTDVPSVERVAPTDETLDEPSVVQSRGHRIMTNWHTLFGVLAILAADSIDQGTKLMRVPDFRPCAERTAGQMPESS